MEKMEKQIITPVIKKLGKIPHPAKLFPIFQNFKYPVLLDSNTVDSENGRYSYLSANPFLVLTSTGDHVTIDLNGKRIEKKSNPFIELNNIIEKYKLAPISKAEELPPFQGGLIGYFGYELSKITENIKQSTLRNPDLPDLVLPFYDWVLAHDNVTNNGYIFATGLPNKSKISAKKRITEIMHYLESNQNICNNDKKSPVISSISSNFSKSKYLNSIKKIQKYIAQGEVYQVNLSQRFQSSFKGNPWVLYSALRESNISAFASYLSFPNATILSFSPEEFLNFEKGMVLTRPIKGTKPRGVTPQEDEIRAKSLLKSEKDLAENLMIVDVLRNDLGKVCKIGSIKTPYIFKIEKHPSVWHLVSSISGELDPKKNIVDLIESTFPGGSITGAPKIRAMEIIEEIEPHSRGPYCGSIGYISCTGPMKTSIVIRTLIITGEKLYLQVGGGIVADSIPQLELEETHHKASALFTILNKYISKET